jgi:hypothetical protein
MKPTDDCLKRLLKATARMPRPEPGVPTAGFETGALAAWRTSRLAREWDEVLWFFRLGLGCATVLMIVIVALSLQDVANQPAREFAMPTVALNLALSQ